MEVRVQEASKDIYWVAEQQELEVNTKAGVLRTKGKLTKIAEFRVNGQRSRVIGQKRPLFVACPNLPAVV